MKYHLVLLLIFPVAQAPSKLLTAETNSTSSFLVDRRGENHTIDGKIHGGSFVRDIRAFPWMVSIKMRKEHECGGGLLTLSYVITACHCVADIPEENAGKAKPRKEVRLSVYKIVAGTLNIKVHRLMKTRKPFRWTPYVRPLKLFAWGKQEFNKKFTKMMKARREPICVVSGWGDTRKGDFRITKTSDQLRQVRMTILTERDCHKAWKTLYPVQYENFNFWKHGQICTASKYRNESDCAGDSGSPFVCNGYLIATVSYGTADCATGPPSVYQTVADALDWIQRKFKGKIFKEKGRPRKSQWVSGNHTNTTGSGSGHQTTAVLNEFSILAALLITAPL